MRVHFASGEHPFTGWLNIDLYCPADLAVDLNDELPAEIDGITHAYVGHYLEHITPTQATKFLARIRPRMRAGGQIHVIGPDVEKADLFYRAGMIPAHLRQHVGRCIIPDDPGGESHLWDCTGRAVESMLVKTEWRHVREMPIQLLPADIPMINPAGWQFYVTARTESLPG